jgi:hypothetical protein
MYGYEPAVLNVLEADAPALTRLVSNEPSVAVDV